MNKLARGITISFITLTSTIWSESLITIRALNNSGVGTSATEGTIALDTQVASDSTSPQPLIYILSDLDLDGQGGNNDSVKLNFIVTTDGQNLITKTTRTGWMSSGAARLNGTIVIGEDVFNTNEFVQIAFDSMEITADDPNVEGSFVSFSAITMGGWAGGDTAVVNQVIYGTSDGSENKTINLLTDGNNDHLTHIKTAFVPGICAGDVRPEGSDFIIKIGLKPNVFTNTSGDNTWTNAANWSIKIPDTDTSAIINDGFTVDLTGSNETAKSLEIGSIAEGSGSISNGSLTIYGETKIATDLSATGSVHVVEYLAGNSTANASIGSADNAQGILTASSGSITGAVLNVGVGNNAIGSLDIGMGSLSFNTIVAGSGINAEGTISAAALFLSPDDLDIGINSNATGQITATTGHIESRSINMASGQDSSAILHLGNGDLSITNRGQIKLASGDFSTATLNAGSLTLNPGATLKIAEGENASATISLDTPIVLSGTNGLYIGTSVGSSHNVTAADLAITSPIGGFFIGENTGASITQLINEYDSYGFLRIDLPVSITNKTHQISTLIINDTLTMGTGATFEILPNCNIQIASTQGDSIAMDLADWNVTNAFDGSSLYVAEGDQATGEFTYTNDTFNSSIYASHGEDSDSTVYLKTLIGENTLSICSGSENATSQVHTSTDATVGILRVGRGIGAMASLNVNGILENSSYLQIADSGSNSVAHVTATTFNRSYNGNINIATANQSEGHLIATNGVLLSKDLSVATGAQSTGILSIPAGTMTVAAKSSINIATGTDSAATVAIAITSSTNAVRIGTGTNATGHVTLTGGTLSASSLELGGVDGSGVILLNGGSINITGLFSPTNAASYINVIEKTSTLTLNTNATENTFSTLWDEGTLQRNGESGLTGKTFTNYFQVNDHTLTTSTYYPIPEIQSNLLPSGLELSWDSAYADGQIYRVEFKTNMIYQITWDLNTQVTGDGGILSITTRVDHANAYYRITSGD